MNCSDSRSELLGLQAGLPDSLWNVCLLAPKSPRWCVERRPCHPLFHKRLTASEPSEPLSHNAGKKKAYAADK